jgi:glucosamine-6-phosphate deaminase
MKSYRLSRKQFEAHCPFSLRIVPDWEALNRVAAETAAELLRRHNGTGTETTMILPVGPLRYEPLAELVNRERVSLERLTIFMMDEFLDDSRESLVPLDHPLSFRRFMKETFLDRLDPALGFSTERLVFPAPDDAAEVSRRILERRGVDLCFAGIGISGHLAFNDPSEPDDTVADLDAVRNSTARVVMLSRESRTQLAMGATHGDWSAVPTHAATLGMKEILASIRICLLGMRSWHAGMLRRALFGPVTRDCPAALVQEHPNVDVLVTELAAGEPTRDALLDLGEGP